MILWVFLGFTVAPWLLILILGIVFDTIATYPSGSSPTLLDRENAVGYWRDHTGG